MSRPMSDHDQREKVLLESPKNNPWTLGRVILQFWRHQNGIANAKQCLNRHWKCIM